MSNFLGCILLFESIGSRDITLDCISPSQSSYSSVVIDWYIGLLSECLRFDTHEGAKLLSWYIKIFQVR